MGRCEKCKRPDATKLGHPASCTHKQCHFSTRCRLAAKHKPSRPTKPAATKRKLPQAAKPPASKPRSKALVLSPQLLAAKPPATTLTHTAPLVHPFHVYEHFLENKRYISLDMYVGQTRQHVPEQRWKQGYNADVQRILANDGVTSRLVLSGLTRNQLTSKAIMDAVEQQKIEEWRATAGVVVLNRTGGNNWRDVPLEEKRRSFFRRVG